MSRIASANCGSTWSQDFGYDPFGNITKSGSSAWTPGYYTATNRYALGGTSYDANGNLLTDTFHTYTWDADGNLLTSDSTTLIYDALGRMVQEGNTSLLMGPMSNKPLASMSGQTVNERFVPLPGGSMMRSSWGYRYGDWLGSVRLQTSFTQTLVSDLSYAPFGETYAAAGSHSDSGFTQGATDSLGVLQTHGIYDFPFRKYPAAQGRWLSPDPAGMAAADPTNPQSWNRYAYVMNNPLGFVDPLGLCGEVTGQTWTSFTVDGTTTPIGTTFYYDDRCYAGLPPGCSLQNTYGGIAGEICSGVPPLQSPANNPGGAGEGSSGGGSGTASAPHIAPPIHTGKYSDFLKCEATQTLNDTIGTKFGTSVIGSAWASGTAFKIAAKATVRTGTRAINGGGAFAGEAGATATLAGWVFAYTGAIALDLEAFKANAICTKQVYGGS